MTPVRVVVVAMVANVAMGLVGRPRGGRRGGGRGGVRGAPGRRTRARRGRGSRAGVVAPGVVRGGFPRAGRRAGDPRRVVALPERRGAERVGIASRGRRGGRRGGRARGHGSGGGVAEVPTRPRRGSPAGRTECGIFEHRQLIQTETDASSERPNTWRPADGDAKRPRERRTTRSIPEAKTEGANVIDFHQTPD